MPSTPDAHSRELPLKFTRLLNATTVNDAGRLALVIANERYPLIDGIPILLKEHRCYLHRLNRFLETQLQKLEAFRGHPADRFWAEPQSLELQKRMIAVRAGLQTDLESASDPDAWNAPLTSKYDGEANTDIYTRIAWGHLSVCTGRGAAVFPDAGELYTKLATLIRSWLPPNGVFLDLGCGVGRSVVDAARIAPDGLAIGFDLSLSKVVRARTISQGRAVLRYPVREQEGLIEAQIQGQDRLNTAFVIGDAAHVLLPDRSIDCILLASVIGLIQDPIDLLREVFRILKPTGHVIIADPFDAFYDYDCPSDHRLTTNGVLQLVEQVARGVLVELIGPVPYQEHWAHSKTVTYDTMLITVSGQD
jgi:SAM-dependent methyltransferase